jgi:hypothetical protein
MRSSLVVYVTEILIGVDLRGKHLGEQIILNSDQVLTYSIHKITAQTFFQGKIEVIVYHTLYGIGREISLIEILSQYR